MVVLHAAQWAVPVQQLIVKHEAVAKFEQYFALSQPIALNKPNFDAEPDDMTCLRANTTRNYK